MPHPPPLGKGLGVMYRVAMHVYDPIFKSQLIEKK